MTKPPFLRIAYDTAMLEYGSDKPDLRIPLKITDVTEHFAGSGFGLFAKIAAEGGVVRAIPAPGTAANPRSFFDKLNEWAREQGAGGLGYIQFDADGPKGRSRAIWSRSGRRRSGWRAACRAGDSVFFAAGKPDEAAKFAGAVRLKLGEDLGLVAPDEFRFCWITDFPMYELNEETGQVDFSHNPFSMPQGGMEALNTMDPLTIKAFQYDIVCNGIELSSGAIRNHRPDIMIRAFEIAGLPAERRGGAFRRHAECVPLRRAAAWRLRAGHRPHRHAAGRRAEHPRGDPVPAQPAGRGPDDGRAGRGAAGAAEGAVAEGGPAAEAKLSRKA